MKKQLLLLVMMFLPMVAMADAVEIDGIYYLLVPKSKLAEVTNNPNYYSGSVVIPPKVTYEGVEYSVTSIGYEAFDLCMRLTSVTIPNSVTTIGNFAFGSCSGLTSITIPNSVLSLGDGAFSSCRGLTSITIPNSVTTIGGYAFAYCRGLTSVTIPNSVTSLEDGVFKECNSLTSITIPNSVTKIMSETFYNCTSLTSITIPNSVTKIGSSAFIGCSGLTSITFGSGIKEIYSKAFAECKNLENVYCYAEKVPNTSTNAFENSYVEYAKLHVPDASLAEYSNTDPWSQFGTKVGLSGGSTQKCKNPTISYGGKKLTFSCETEGVEYVYEIKDTDIKKGYDSEVSLAATYEISVYATKQGYDNSDVATATLVWGSASFTETTGTTSAIPLTHDVPVLIKSYGGVLTVEGLDDGQQVNVYGINGTEAGSAVSRNGQAQVDTNLQPGSVAIIKIGEKSVKVVVK